MSQMEFITPGRTDLGDRECRLEAVQFAAEKVGIHAPDFMDEAAKMAEFLMTGKFEPRTREPAQVHQFPAGKS